MRRSIGSPATYARRPRPLDEFASIKRHFLPLTHGAPEALDLADDAAVIPSRPGFDLVVTKDAMVEGVHFLSTDRPEWIARKLLRVNLSDLAAKAAEPYGYFLAVAWPPAWGEELRARFASGLEADQRLFDLCLFGGDTVSTPGPLTLSATALGWVPTGRMIKRSGAKVGDLLLVSGTIGDASLGLIIAQGGLLTLPDEAKSWLLQRFHLPEPRLALRPALRDHIAAAADVSDGLLADASHVAEASGLGLNVDLERLPLSPAGALWAAAEPDRGGALVALATGGDDYELVCASDPEQAKAAAEACSALGVRMTVIGRFTAKLGISVCLEGQELHVEKTGWSHG